jgi:hypothetical protein
MKNRIKFLLLFSLLFCLKSVGQKPGDKKVLSDNSTFKGKVELWREKKVQRHEKRMEKRHERRARRKNTTVVDIHTKIQRKKTRRGKNKAKPVPAS